MPPYPWHGQTIEKGQRRHKAHIGFNLNQSIPSKIFLTHGKGDERPFVKRIVTKGINKTEKEVRVVGYRVDGKEYWVATDRYDLTGEQIALIYKLRWNIETFFGWWKRHLKVYHLIARSQYGLLV